MRRINCSLLVLLLCLIATASAQNRLTTPKDHFGFNIGDDYHLANYTQYEAYLKRLDQESDRMKVLEMGKSAEGRTMYLAIITSPENHKKLDRYREISRRLALAEGLSDEQARALAKEGKAIVWIDGGLHATEVLGAHQLIETIWQLNSRTDEETMRFLNDAIVLGCLVNPDGMELVSNWYMREPEPTRRSTSNIPRLYQKYIGHDNNRDFYMSAQPESEAINRVFYHEWFPQIVYNHHQTGPAGTVMFAPPFRDPFNYNFDPLVPLGIDLVGASMHSRFALEGKPGVTMRSGASYSTWWNGGLRTTVYFHNMIGLLTETIGNPTPIEIPLVLRNQLPRGDLPFPIAPQKWHFRQSIEYSITANRAVIDVASRHREQFLFNAYQMGKNSIERGSRDHWTFSPKEIAETQAALDRERQQQMRGQQGSARAGDNDPDAERLIRAGLARGTPVKYYEAMRTTDKRDPRGYILPSDQPDFLTATKFVNALIKTGVTIHRATSDFQINGKSYPAGSYIVKAAQAFRPHVMDMFEPQDHPNDFAYPGGPPTPPYDSAGWTMAFQMGVKFDRLLDAFDGPFEKVNGLIKPAAGKVASAPNAGGYFADHRINDSFIATNRLLKENEEVYWIKQAFSAGGKNHPAGTIFIPAKPSTQAKLQKIATELGLNFEATTTKPAGEMFKLRPVRIGLWDRYGGSMPSGWTRWLLEQFEFPFTVVYPQTLDAGNLIDKFDVLLFVTGAIPGAGGGGFGGRGGGGGFGGDVEPGGGGQGGRAQNIPEEFRGTLGAVSIGKTVPQLRQFLEAGGSIITVGSSTSLGYHTNLPIANALVERLPDGTERPLSRDKLYIPGSILQASLDNTNPLAYGMPEKIDLFFDNSPVFRLKPEAALKGVKPVAWFDSDKPLRSGWAWGQKYLQDGVAVIEAQVGKGRLFMFGPEITFRAQPHGTFKFLFNGIYYGRAETVKW
jgi:hypothetical protein